MNVGIMQPYFFPYIGYFQLINSVDTFVLYDNIKYTKKGWISRNRILENGQDNYISLQLKKDSDYLDIRERFLADSFKEEKKSILRRIHSNYHKAKQFESVYSLVEYCINYSDNNLFNYLHNSISTVSNYLGIKTVISISSDINADHTAKSQDRVISICKSLSASTYINAIGGKELYSKDSFLKEGITLNFLQSNSIEYKQFNNTPFIPWLSIIDVMMFNEPSKIQSFLNEYTLI